MLATDPDTGETGARRVDATIYTPDDREFTDLSVTSADGATGALTATDHHPFWVENDSKWVDAGDLGIGNTLRTPSGRSVDVTGVKSRTGLDSAYNLTVQDLHTYYVLAGNAPVLVHNSSGLCGVWKSEFDNLPKGKQGHVREMPDEQTMRAAFDRWTAGAEQLPARGPKIPEVYRLEDGTVIQWRTASASGGATIDIQPGAGGKH